MAHTTFTARYVQPLPHTATLATESAMFYFFVVDAHFPAQEIQVCFCCRCFLLLFSQELSTRIIHALSGAQRAAYVGFATFSSYVSLYRIGMSSMAMCDVVSGVYMFNFFVTCCR